MSRYLVPQAADACAPAAARPHPRRLLRHAVALLVVGCGGARAAQPAADTLNLPPVVIWEPTFTQPLSQALPSASVITRRQIVDSGASNLTTLLQRVAGVQLTFSGGPGQPSTTLLRGFGSSELGVLVLLDGVPLTAQDTTGSSGYLQNLGTDQIQRIEVVRGNVSAIYGSGAIGGVILITTRDGSAQRRASISAMAGSQDTGSLSASAGQRIGNTRVYAGFSRYTTQSIPSINPAQNPYVQGQHSDGYANSTANAALVQQLAPGQSLGLRAFRSDGKYTYSNTQGSGETLQQLVQLFSDNRIDSRWNSHLSVSQQTVDNRNDYAGAYAGNSRTRVQLAQWNNHFELDRHWSLTGGLEWQHQAIETDGPGAFPNVSRNARALFAGIVGEFAGNQLQFNLRRDDVDGLTGQTTSYLGMSHHLDSHWKVLASYSTAFNAPPLGYLYASSPGYSEANPALRPEKAHSVEAGVQWHSGPSLVRATLFDTRMTDQWVYGLDQASGLYRFSNVARSRTRGVELSASSSWRGWMLDANLTLQQPVDLSQPGDPTLQRRARSLANLGISRDWHRVLFGASLHYSGPRPDLNYANYPATPVVLGSYTTVDLSASGKLARRWAWQVHVRNLLDKSYQTGYSYNRTPFGVFVGLTWHPPGW